MTKQQLENLLKSIDGVTFSEWSRIRAVIDTRFLRMASKNTLSVESEEFLLDNLEDEFDL